MLYVWHCMLYVWHISVYWVYAWHGMAQPEMLHSLHGTP